MSHFDVYGRMAGSNLPPTCQNGRYITQREAERLVPGDVISKLKIRPEDSFLDIGCGLGTVLIPVSAMVHEATGCDHPAVVEKLKGRFQADNVSFLEGNFFELDIRRTFTKVLAYSVLHCLEDEAALFSFVDKALKCLHPAGIMLLGDVANSDKKARFLASERGRLFQREWEHQQKNVRDNQPDGSAYYDGAERSVVINDGLIIRLLSQIRQRGYHSFIVDQPQRLPFGNTREDILIIGPEYCD